MTISHALFKSMSKNKQTNLSISLKRLVISKENCHIKKAHIFTFNVDLNFPYINEVIKIKNIFVN